MQSEKTGFMNEMISVFKYSLGNPFFKMICIGVSCIVLMTTMAHADNRDFFETWRKIEGFDVGYACNWTATTPGPESLFEVKKLKAAEMIADVDSIEFRLIKPTSKERTRINYNGSNFFVKLDKFDGYPISLRILYPFSSDGFCGYIFKSQDGSSIDLLSEAAAPIDEPPSPKIMRWVDREIASCYRKLKRAFNPDVLFDCRRDLEPNSNGLELTDIPSSSVMPEGIIPASVARIYLKQRDKVFSITTYDDKIEIEKVENLK